MPRPLIQLGVGQLEEMFAKAKSDAEVLGQLVHELQYRQVPRAVALLAKVKVATYDNESVTPPVVTAAPLSKAPELPIEYAGLSAQRPMEPSPPPQIAKPAQQKPPTPPVAPAPAPAPAMPVDEAYKQLKATPSSTWESIELMRRQLVQQASPVKTVMMSLEMRAQLREDAQRVNAAYATLAWHRAHCG